MTREELRLECIKACIPTNIVNWDETLVFQKAEQVFDFVTKSDDNRKAVALPTRPKRVSGPGEPIARGEPA